jgi:uncharacterized protein
MTPETVSFLAHSRFAKLFAIFLMMASLFIAALTVNTFKEYRYIGGGVPETTTVTVSGIGEAFAVPDIALFTFSVIEERGTAPEAQDVAAKKINEILKYLRDNGVKENDIKTVNYSLYPQYDYTRQICNNFGCQPGKQTLRGFEANQSVQVKVRAIDTAGGLVSGVGERGASNVSGLSFTVDDMDAVNREARKDAIDEAKEKAKELADDLGVRLVRIVSFSEGGGGVPIYARAMMAEGLVMDGADASVAPELPVGENKITANISITYEIR